ncbi:MAG: protein kinase domain-containing protein, partial [Rudaea sp.]
MRLIGKGSYGEVWLARNIVGTYRAVKVIYRRAFDTDRPYEREFDGIKRFEPLSRSHDGLVDILQLGRNDESEYFYYVMEIADNCRGTGIAGEDGYEPRTLRSEVRERGRLPVAECVSVGMKVTEALEYLHRQGLVHRDIKPSNIIFVGGAPKLADIGLVAAVDDTRSFVGTEGFIPPEGPGNPRADLYSLGKVLYEVSTGKDRQDYPELPADIREEAGRQGFPDLNEIIIKACFGNPDRRYQSAGQMHAELSALFQGKSIRKLRAGESKWALLKAGGTILLGLALLGIGARLLNPGFGAGLLAIYALGLLYLLVRASRTADLPVKRAAKTAGQRGLWLAACALLIVALAVVTGWIVSLRAGSAIPFASRDFIMVADFSNKTGDPVFDKSLWTAFIVGLQQSRYANVLSRTRIDQALARMGKGPETVIDEAIGREICLRENTRGLAVCDIAGFGSSYVLSVRLVDPQTGETLRAYQQSAVGKDAVIAALGRIAARLREDLGESLSSIRQSSRSLPQVTTESLDALKAFADGRYLWRRGSYKEAVRLYEKALALDSDFAMAHAELGSAFFSFLYNSPAQGEEHYKAALATADRISDRERLYITTAYERDLGHVEEAIQYHRLFLAAYPDDADMRYNLGTFLMLNRRSEEAVEQFREVIRIAPNHTGAFFNLAASLQQLDRCEEALAHYDKAFDLEPVRLMTPNLNSEYAFTLARVGKLAKARATLSMIVDKPDTRMPGLRSLALLDMYEGKYRDAVQRLEEALLLSVARREAITEVRNRLFLWINLGGYGDRAKQVQELDAANLRLMTVKEPQVWLEARIGIANARSHKLAKASVCLRYVQRRADPRSPQHQSFLHMLEGELALAQGNFGNAEQRLLLADREFSSPETIASLARAYDTDGRTPQAVEYYEKLIASGRAPLGWEPQQEWIT